MDIFLSAIIGAIIAVACSVTMLRKYKKNWLWKLTISFFLASAGMMVGAIVHVMVAITIYVLNH